MKEKISRKYMNLIGIILVIIAFVLLACFFLRGEVVVEGKYSGVEKSESLFCESNGMIYPFFSYDNSSNKTIRVNALFENDELSSVSLVYLLYYSDSKFVTDSENLNHAAMNISFGNSGLGADALGAKFSFFPNGLQFSLYSTKDKINSISAKYFLIDYDGYSISSLQQNYENKDFICRNNNY